MGTWQLQDAKARLSEVIKTAKTDGPQVITQRGVRTAVLVPFEEWKRLHQPTPAIPPKKVLSNEEFLKLLQASPDFEIPDRHAARKRRPKASRN